MCIMCHLASTPIAKRNVDAWLLYYNTYPMPNGSGVILPYDHALDSEMYTFQYDADGATDAKAYNLPGDDFDYSWTF